MLCQHRLVLCAAVVIGISGFADVAQAQTPVPYRNPFRVPTISRAVRTATRIPPASNLSGTIRSSAFMNSGDANAGYPLVNTGPVISYESPKKPYSNIYRRPTVSPFLNLDRDDRNGVSNYFTLVRPQLRQQSINRQQSLRLEGLQREVGAIESSVGFNPYGSDQIRSTGHAATFLDTSHYYPR